MPWISLLSSTMKRRKMVRVRCLAISPLVSSHRVTWPPCGQTLREQGNHVQMVCKSGLHTILRTGHRCVSIPNAKLSITDSAQSLPYGDLLDDCSDSRWCWRTHFRRGDPVDRPGQVT